MKARVRKLSERDLREILGEFESKYGMSSEDFYRKYEAGEMDDSDDFVAWASYYYMLTVPVGSTKVRA